VTITKMTIQDITNYGIVVSGARNNPIITYNKILNTGYIGFYYDAEGATTGGNFSYNTIDRSQIAPSAVHQLAIGVRGNSSATTPVSTGWVITNNTVTMPLNPTDWTAECIEIRALVNANISNNTFNNSSIGVSLYRSTGTIVANNKFNNAQLEAIEVNDCYTTACTSNIITGGIGNGYLFDGTAGSNGTTITGDVISGTIGDCIHTSPNTQNIKIVNAVLTVGTNAKAINLLGTTGVTVTGTTINGNNSAGQMAVYLTNCAGGLTISGGTIANFTKCLVYISNTTTGLVTDNVSVSGNKVSGVTTPLGTYLMNGSKVGTNVKVALQ
ncbi:MAG: right-handed parallel beta-helix repeat-containing protein, partial [Mucilaginibacter sp.]